MVVKNSLMGEAMEMLSSAATETISGSLAVFFFWVDVYINISTIRKQREIISCAR